MRPIAFAAPFAVLTLALAACSEPAPKDAPAPAPAAAPAMLADVDLAQPVSAVGTEPFWGIEITPETLTYTSPDGAPVTAPNPGADLQGTTATYTTTAGGQPLEITLIATECSDGMSDRTYPLTAIVKLGGRTLNGCAGSKAALAAEPPA
ncbi:membrane protein [soil metagenome]